MPEPVSNHIRYPDPAAQPELPPARSERLTDAAESVGTVVGSAVHTVRHLPDRLQEMKERFTVIRGRTKARASDTAADLKETAEQKLQDARNLASRRLHDARERASEIANEYPLHVIAGAAAFAFVFGIILRIWRAHHE